MSARRHHHARCAAKRPGPAAGSAPYGQGRKLTMANSRFGNLGDVWEHLVLAEVLERERPRWYAETHAGSAAYLLNRDPQREFGIWRFLAAAPRSAELARSRYYAIAGSCASASPATYSGSPLLAMTILGNSSSYLLCDLDPGSAADLRSRSRQLGLRVTRRPRRTAPRHGSGRSRTRRCGGVR
jgi:hypothetical protein